VAAMARRARAIANVSAGDKRMTWKLDATALSALLSAREITPLRLLEQSLDRLDALEPVLNAFTHVDRDGALAAAKTATARQAAGARLGPLDGIPVSVKDNIFVAGMPAQWGSLLFRDYIPDRDDICVERLRAAGAVIVGKTTTPELAMLGRTDSRLSGITRSPWDPALTPGGSSGGASASVAAGITTLAIGTDMGGSTRLPASYTGLVGMRPSTGRIARRYGFPATCIDFQVIGPFARTMRDMQLLYGVLAGSDPRDPYSLRFPPAAAGAPGHRFRIGWFTSIGHEGATPEVVASVAAAVASLSGANCKVAQVSAPFDLGTLRAFHAVLTAAAVARIVSRFPDRWRAETCDNVRVAAERGLGLSAAAYVDALDALAAWRADTTTAWGDYDALIVPTAAAPAWRAEDEAPPGLTPATQGMFGAWVNAAGLPGISVPGQPHPDGRPIGVQIVAPFGHDAVVLEIARRLETLAPWAGRWPAMALNV
jgi:aspartyl-tRNA(Asn)/glutamyl-tRNA(Gln) amidotransferase subunit A